MKSSNKINSGKHARIPQHKHFSSIHAVKCFIDLVLNSAKLPTLHQTITVNN